MAGKQTRAVCVSVFKNGEKPDKEELARILRALAAHAGKSAAGIPAHRKEAT